MAYASCGNECGDTEACEAKTLELHEANAMSTQSLNNAAKAAGYAFAPYEDLLCEPRTANTLENAVRRIDASAKRAVPPSTSVTVYAAHQHGTQWLRSWVHQIWGGRAAA